MSQQPCQANSRSLRGVLQTGRTSQPGVLCTSTFLVVVPMEKVARTLSKGLSSAVGSVVSAFAVPPLPSFLHPDRVQYLNNKAPRPIGTIEGIAGGSVSPPKTPVLYWMQSSQRTEYNHALELAVCWANRLATPLVVLFVLCDNYPGANARSYSFMLEGLSEVKGSLERKGIKFMMRRSTVVPDTVLDTCELLQVPLLVTDRGYTRTDRGWKDHVARHAACPVVQVESNVVVPVERASKVQERSAAGLRRKLTPHLDTFLQPVPEHPLEHKSQDLSLPRPPDLLDVSDPHALLETLSVDRSVRPISWRRGGTVQAKALLAAFLRDKLKKYRFDRTEMHKRHVSYLSAYIHFGQISTLYVAQRVKAHSSSDGDDREKFTDELIVNRELGANYCFYNPHYDSYDGLPDWAKATLEAHASDDRPAILTREQLERAETPDPYWNAAQNEMLHDGYMHNYMRMYWAKQVLIWIQDPREAYSIVMAMNDRYFIDGRDPNGYVGVAWCFGATDRPMVERRIFGKVRMMTPNGLKSKHDVNAYVLQVEGMVKRARSVWGLPEGSPASTTVGGPAAASVAKASAGYSTKPPGITDIRKFMRKDGGGEKDKGKAKVTPAIREGEGEQLDELGDLSSEEEEHNVATPPTKKQKS